jgi:general L-amino acid transport system substrate-binding protein
MKVKFKIFSLLIISCFLSFYVFAGTLDDVKDRGKVRCVVNTGLPGFAAPVANGVG